MLREKEDKEGVEMYLSALEEIAKSDSTYQALIMRIHKGIEGGIKARVREDAKKKSEGDSASMKQK